MSDEAEVAPPAHLGRRLGSRNKATLAAQKMRAHEAEALTRKAVAAAFAGNSTAMRLCLERILPRDRAVEFALPRIKSAADIAGAMGAVTAALAGGLITPGEAQAIARVFHYFCANHRNQRLRPTFAGARNPPGPKTGRPSRGLGRFQVLQPEEERPQIRCSCSEISCYGQP